MVKKFFSVICAVLCAVGIMFTLGACDDDKNNISKRYISYDVEEKDYDTEYYLDIDYPNFKMHFGEDSDIRSVSGAVETQGTEIKLIVTKDGVESVFMRGRIKDGVFYSPTESGRIWFCEDGKTPNDAQFDSFIKFESSKGKATVVSVDNGTQDTVEIPSEHDGDTVTAIGVSPFSSCVGLKSVTVPSSVTDLGEFAFSHYDGDIIFDKNSKLNNIAANAFSFYGGNKLTLPASVQSIDDRAFSSCEVNILDFSALKINRCPIVQFFEGSKIILPNTVSYITKNSFMGTTAQIDFGSNNMIYEISEYAFSSYGGTTVKLPASVHTIKANAFSGSDITSITIPSNVTKIEASAFSLCVDLESVVFEDTLYWYKKNTLNSGKEAVGVWNATANATELTSSYSYDWVRIPE